MEAFHGYRLSYAILAMVGGLLMSQPVAANPLVTTFAYDAGDHVVAVTDPRGLVTAYNYDGLGQLWGLSSPDTGTTTYGYDAYGRRTSLTRANNVQTTYGYDSLNRLVSVSAGGQTQSFAYDSCTNGIGRLCSDSDGTGSTSYGYTPEGWIASRSFTIAGTSYALGYGYDGMGHPVAVTYPDGRQALYSYTRGVVSGVSFVTGGTTVTAASAVTYRPMDAGMVGWTASNGLATTLAYDTDGRLTGINVPGVEALGFSYDATNRLTGIDNALDGTLSQDFGYDEQSRLVSMYSANAVAGYGYDANGNRINTAGTSGSRATSYSATSNRLVSSTGVDPQSYGYDALGNLTTLGGATAYQYDAFNRMRAAGGMTYYVNPEGQRLRKTGAAGTTYFAPDRGGALLAEYSGGQWINYLWLNGRLIGREVNGQLEAIHGDQLGRPQVVTNASQSVVWRAQNWPFTRVVAVANTVPLNLGFPGQYHDAETGLWHNGFRDYDDTLGRYVESDPIGLAGGINTYVYVGGNPLNYVDQLGLVKECKTIVRIPIPLIGLNLEGQQCAENGQAPSVQDAKDAKRMSKDRLDKACKANGYKDAHELKRDLGLGSDRDIFSDRNGNMYSGPRSGSGAMEWLKMNTGGPN
ncbi:RHS repeat-associated core domain-containing protein [Rhodanobacter sp. UC4436_H3]